ncbi:cytochrome P450 4C1 [Nephila pilipes]|uniref:Cytochrome P450 4C1 n=1 Tax=Nephila pilipes TaxID=299642 RepID=A0A8X6T9C6_NEPPI|nr:cytochrome P450 4C1 [Nephila pilipes]GFT78754.1 cytochrome P450 4C1 [Nephila pilipes]
MLTPAFHFNILKDFLPVFNKQSKILNRILKSSSEEEFVDVVPLICKCSLDIICESILGKEMHTQTQPSSPYVKAVVNLTDWVFERMQRPWLWNDFIFKISPSGRRFAKNVAIVQEFTNKVISEKKEELMKRNHKNSPIDSQDNVEGKKHKKLALMDLLLEEHFNNNSISEDGIREEVNTFTFEESLRLYPSVPAFGRMIRNDIEIENKIVPKGSICLVHTFLLHRDPEVFPNPEKFDPDRFSPNNNISRHPFAYVPFSAGPRNCIGQRFALMEMKTVLSSILRNYKVRSLDPRDQVLLLDEIVLRPLNGLRIQIRKRNQTFDFHSIYYFP